MKLISPLRVWLRERETPVLSFFPFHFSHSLVDGPYLLEIFCSSILLDVVSAERVVDQRESSTVDAADEDGYR